jgi:hypothetical protein
LIAARWVLSAAHCAALGELVVRVNEVRFDLVELVTHPERDALLVELDTAPDEREVTPIDVWPSSPDSTWVGARATLAGRGKTETGAVGELLFVQEPIVEVHPTEIWVDGAGRTGACGGDSGGPLLLSDPSGQARIAGVLDRGSGDCLGRDVYTRVDALAAWIHDVLPARETPNGTDCR